MKKIFTLLFCVAAMTSAANATDTSMVERCINVLLGNETPTTIMATNLDANHDGVLSIADVTTLIDQALAAQQVNRAPARNIDVEGMINEMLENNNEEPTISDVSKAIDRNLNNKK